MPVRRWTQSVSWREKIRSSFSRARRCADERGQAFEGIDEALAGGQCVVVGAADVDDDDGVGVRAEGVEERGGEFQFLLARAGRSSTQGC